MSLACIDMISKSRHDMMDKIMSEIVHHIKRLLISEIRNTCHMMINFKVRTSRLLVFDQQT